MSRLRDWRPAGALATTALLCAQPAHARHRLFEPTDLELETPGYLEFDAQAGVIRGSDATRLVVPDFELDLGVTRAVEIDLDGAYSVEGPPGGEFGLDHAAPDSLWFASKLGLWDDRDEHGQAWALGLQLGPKLPIAKDVHGAGFEGLVLVGHTAGRLHLAFEFGGVADPGPREVLRRPRGVESGVDATLALDRAARASVTAELGGVRYFSDDAHQLHATTGVVWAALPDALDVSVLGLVGLLSGGDRYGVLVGVSPRARLW